MQEQPARPSPLSALSLSLVNTHRSGPNVIRNAGEVEMDVHVPAFEMSAQ